MDTLKFSTGNSKLHHLAASLGMTKREVVAFDLPAGWTCPAASLCLSKADPITGTITDGKDMQFRCYAASTEALYTATRNLRWHNFNLLKACSGSVAMADLIELSLTKGIKVIRIHSSGDFFNRDYFMAWQLVASRHPEIKFFGYTKLLPYVNAPKTNNFKLVYSFGGKMDNMVSTEPVAYVVETVKAGIEAGLDVVCQLNPADDFDMVMSGLTFGLALHGTQPKKTRPTTA